MEKELEWLFDVSPTAGTLEEIIWKNEASRIPPGRMGYRTRTIQAGKMVEVEVYPVFSAKDRGKIHEAKRRLTPEQLEEKHHREAEKRIIRLANANFTERDLSVTLTYTGEPPDYSQAQKDVANFLRKVKRLREKRGMEPPKYIYCLEDNESGMRKRIHCHMLLSGGISREEIEAMWRKGYANADRLQPNERGLEGIAKYLVKSQKNRRKWVSSKNLKQPKVRTSDTKLSNAKVRKVAMDAELEAKPILERAYKGCTMVECTVRYSDIVDGVYITALMRDDRKGEDHERLPGGRISA